MARRRSEAMAAGVSRRGRERRIRRLRRTAVLLPALVALVMLAGTAAPQEAAEDGNTSEAIEITADTLEVRQSESVAIFQGSVRAVQGEMVLTAETLTVHYRETEDADGNLGVSRIDAEGDVVVSSPQETAQGQRGFFDVEEGRIELAGGVVLNQGDNVVRGETLTMDLDSGVSQVSGGEGGRVTSLFVPEDESE